jgi:hypothetical protein
MVIWYIWYPILLLFAINMFFLIFMWQMFLVRHTLNEMRYEKNICENFVKTIFGENDTMVVRRDL